MKTLGLCQCLESMDEGMYWWGAAPFSAKRPGHYEGDEATGTVRMTTRFRTVWHASRSAYEQASGSFLGKREINAGFPKMH